MRPRTLGLLALLISSAICTPFAAAQIPLDKLLPSTTEKEQAPVQPADPLDEVEARQAEITARLEVARRVENEEAPAGAPKTEDDPPNEEVELLKRMEAVVAQQKSALQRQSELATAESIETERLETQRVTGFDQPAPYSFLLLDKLHDDLETVEQRRESAQMVVKGATDALDRAKDDAEEAHRKRRRANELARKGNESAKTARPLPLLDLDGQIADEQVKLRRIELKNEKLSLQTLETQAQLLNEQIAIVRPQVVLTKQERQQKLLELDKQESDLVRTLDATEMRLRVVSERLADFGRSNDKESSDKALRAAEMAARVADRESLQQYVSLLNQQLQRLSDRREAWLRRFAAHDGTATAAQLTEWTSEATEIRDQLARERRLQELRMDEIRAERAEVEKAVQATDPQQAELLKWLSERSRAQRELVSHYGRNITDIEQARRIHEALLSEIELDRAPWREWLSASWGAVVGVWGYEIWSSETESVTIAKAVWGIILLCVGILVSRYASRAIGVRLLPKLGIQAGIAAALESMSFYTMVLMATLLALRLVNVPLTIFTFVGGAVAIGIGFGSQNLVNNFISGLILFAERPIRVGDMIEIENLSGTVEHIGARSTRIRTGTNFEIIVPNSTLLQQNVVNWTLSDKQLRCCIPVGVAYGSPTREVARWLRKAAEEHGLVLQRPEPFVLFVGFGDNALEFELHYWIQIRQLAEKRRIESDVRFIIDQYFRDAGLVIAFPQRELHISNVQPLRVQLMDSVEQNEMGKQAAA
jgi:small-conductance mechanosensitive channel